MTGTATVSHGSHGVATGPGWRRDADVVVVGSGAAGISAALTAARAGLRVLVVTKDLVGGATPLAQGGLAAAIGPGDDAASHVSDTLVAGAGLCEPDVVAALAAGAPGAIEWLAGLGARLETRSLRLEGGHSHHRIVHSGDDATGAEVHRVLLRALLASGVEILDRTVALDLTMCGGGHARRVAGLAAGAIGPDGGLAAGVIDTPVVVIAAGGLGQAFATTSNPAGATGDGIAIAARAGVVLRDLEFVQFHPTVLWLPGASGQCPLITEALRGAGAVLRDLDGTPLMAGHDPRGDLAPRDVVSARMTEVIAAGDAGHVWLDATGLDADVLANGFPTVTAACRKHGIDPVTEYIPVAPGAHYSCGGILADLDGRTSVAGLYAVGEAASTGVQGANRLASNSVTEAIIAGRRAGEAIAAWTAGAWTGQKPPTMPPTPMDAVNEVVDTHGTGHGVGRRELADDGEIATIGDIVNSFQRRAGRDAAIDLLAARDAVIDLLIATINPIVNSFREGDANIADRLGRTAAGPETPVTPSTPIDAVDGAADRAGGRSGAVGASGAAGTVVGGRGSVAEGRRWLAGAMSRCAGVLRDAEGLGELVRMIDKGDGAGGSKHAFVHYAELGLDRELDLDLEAVEAANLRAVSLLIAAGALRRAESRGCHRRRDAAGTAGRAWHTVMRWDGRELVVAEEPL